MKPSETSLNLFITVLYVIYPFSVLSQLTTGPMLDAIAPDDQKGLAQGINNAVMNFVMALTTTLNRRCISFKKEEISPKNAMTFADLSNVKSTTVLINEIIDYSIKNPHFLNQIAWLHAAKAISQKWPCI